MTLSAQAAADAARFVSAADWAETVTYSPHGGDDVACTAVVEHEPALVEQSADGRAEVRTARLYLAVAEVAAWDSRDYVTIGAERWEVVNALEEDGAMRVVQIQRVTHLDRSGPQHRGRG